MPSFQFVDRHSVSRSLRGGAVAIGNFDGVHLGHQAVLKREQGLARQLGAPFGAMLFEPHPRQFFQPGEPFFRLTPLDRKIELLAGLRERRRVPPGRRERWRVNRNPPPRAWVRR